VFGVLLAQFKWYLNVVVAVLADGLTNLVPLWIGADEEAELVDTFPAQVEWLRLVARPRVRRVQKELTWTYWIAGLIEVAVPFAFWVRRNDLLASVARDLRCHYCYLP
jgi:hypothetical protein